MNGEQVIAPNAVVAASFANPWIGFVLAVALLAAALAIILWHGARHYRPLMRALTARADVLSPIAGAPQDHEAQEAFVAHFQAIEEVMTSGGPETAELRHAWNEFSETLVDVQGQLRATARPEDYFLHLGDETRALAWWANIFVALGLTFTFLGIIAALVNAVVAMSGGADMTRMQAALIGLLTVTAGKFWTSIGGVLASIFLRIVDRQWHTRIQRGLERLVDRIERGTAFLPPQRIAADQLRELEQQSTALTDFSHKLAAAIGDALGQHFQPVVQGLSGIQTSLNEFREGGFTEIGKNVAGALNDHAGAQMNALAGALTEMTATLDRVTSGLDGASGRASEQIAEAASQFANASDEMLRAVRELVETARTENGAAMKAALDDFAAATGEIRGAFDGMRGQIQEMGSGLSAGAARAAERNAEVLEQAARALEQAASGAQAGMGAALDEAIKRSGDEASRAISAAFAAFGERFDAASAGLVSTLRDTSIRMESYAGAIERSTGAANGHADRLAEAGREAQNVSTMLGRAASEVATAATPIRDAAAQLGSAALRIEQAASHQLDSGAQQRAAMETLSISLERTSSAAAEAWEGYRNRFAEVDQALAKALDQIRNASAEHATALTTQVGRIDQALANAADKLGAAIEPLTELASALEDAAGRRLQAAE